jgi:hypothetical protein
LNFHNVAAKPFFVSAAALLLLCGGATAQTKVLFVGNSFTYGANEPEHSYNKKDITDENGTNQGGVPGIFKKLTAEAGLSYEVSIEAVGGQTLGWHYSNKAPIIGRGNWDIVVLQDLSTGPLPASHAGHAEAFFGATGNLKKLVLAHHPGAKFFLYETWASPTTLKSSGYADLAAMQNDLRDAYFKADRDFEFQGVVRVGEAFLRVIDQKLADPANGSQPGTFKLWAGDNRHASRHGSYLAAALFFAKITGKDPRDLAIGRGTAAGDLGISDSEATALHGLAFEVAASPEPAAR